MTEFVFIWGSLFLLTYCYVLYPLLIFFASRIAHKPWRIDSSCTPRISVLLAVYNEELVLENCLDRLLALEYPTDSLEIIVGSDGSTDRTNEILQRYAGTHSHIQVCLYGERRGKIPVINDIASQARGEVLFFTDADVTLNEACLRMHARHYSDPQIGGVAGNLVFATTQQQAVGPLGSEQYYMSIENVLRRHEAELHSTVGIFGGHYSIRRTHWKSLPNEPICDELFIALETVRDGKRMIFEPQAVALEYFGRSMSDEFKRKTRFASRGMTTMQYFWSLLSPSSGWPSLMLWSHKVIRWFSPLFLLLLLAGTVIGQLRATESSIYSWLLGFELLGGLLIVLGAALGRFSKQIALLQHAYWFVTMNLAFAIGLWRFMWRSEQKFWAQSKRVRIGTAGAPLPEQEVAGR